MNDELYPCDLNLREYSVYYWRQFALEFCKKSGADGWGSGKNAYFCENLVKNAR